MNQLSLWDEVEQRAGHYDNNNHKTDLKFPRKITISEIACDEIRIETIRGNEEYVNRFFYRGQVIREDKNKEIEVWDAHDDALNFLRGEYVRQHRNGSK